MWALLAAAATNILLDYFFIFVFRWGLFGAAIATGISELIGALIVFSHLCHHTSTVHLVRVKLSIRSLKLTLRNIGYMIRLGGSASLNEIAISIMIVTGNLAFMHSLGPNGVAAFSIICYLFPIVFLIFSAIVQSVQPIVSYNYGGNLLSRSNEAVRWALGSAITFAIVVMCIFIFYSSNVVGLFIPDPSNPARLYATEGLSLFSLDFIFFAINIVAIGYYASIEWLARATTLTIIRGILPVVFFYFLPLWIGISGIWLAVALSDALITIVILFLFFAQKYKHKRRDS